jgi:hypothetical protein
MTKDEIVIWLETTKSQLDDIACFAKYNLKGYAGDAIDLAYEAVCHAIDLVNVSEEVE